MDLSRLIGIDFNFPVSESELGHSFVRRPNGLRLSGRASQRPASAACYAALLGSGQFCNPYYIWIRILQFRKIEFPTNERTKLFEMLRSENTWFLGIRIVKACSFHKRTHRFIWILAIYDHLVHCIPRE